MFDSHIHTKFSSDSKMNIEEAIDKSRQINIGIILTEHMDLNCPDPNGFRFNCDEYFKQYSGFRNDKLLLGIELGMNKEYSTDNMIIASKYNFDYVLGSIHFIGNNDIYYPETYEGKSKKEVYEHYFKEMIENLISHDYIDCLGHIDYITRYAVYEDKSLKYDEFKIYIDEVLNILLKRDIVIELNTRRLDNKQVLDELKPVYKRYSELGGRYVVLGSDAHKSSDIASNFQVGKELAEYCGLKEVYFKERKLQYS